MADIDLDFERAATLLDVVQKVASIVPAYTALSGVAMGELRKYNDTAQEYLNELGRERLKAEQEAAAELNRQNQAEAVAREKAEAEIAERTRRSNAIQPILVMPGEPNPMVDINKRQGLTPEGQPSANPADDPTPHELGPEDDETVKRRV